MPGYTSAPQGQWESSSALFLFCNLKVWEETQLKMLEKISESLALEVVDLSPQVERVVYIDQFSPLLIVRWDFFIKLG